MATWHCHAYNAFLYSSKYAELADLQRVTQNRLNSFFNVLSHFMFDEKYTYEIYRISTL